MWPPLVLEEGQTVYYMLQDHIAGVQKSLVSCVWKGECQWGLRMPWLPEALYTVRQQNRVEAG